MGRLDSAAVRRGHADVDDRDIGFLGDHEGHQPVRVSRLADDLEPLVREQACDALPEERRVVAERDPDGAHASGIEAVTTVPPPVRAAAVNVPPAR